MKIKVNSYWCVVLSLVVSMSIYRVGYTQSGIIDFEDQKWMSVVGHKLYRGGPNNTLTDQEMGVDFIVSYGEMWVTNVYGMGRMLFFSPIISTTSTTDDLGRVLIQFSNQKEWVKLKVSHDPTPVSSPDYMTVKFYRDYDPNNSLHTVDVPWNGGAFTDVEYSNASDGIQMVIIETKYAENNLDNLEFTEMGAGPSNLSLTVVSSSEIDLNWQDNSDNEDGFEIERKTGAGGSWSQIGTVSANTNSYSDDGLSSNTTYYYRVRAYGAGWESPYSNEASATTLSPFQAGTFDFNDGTIQDWSLFPAHTSTVDYIRGGYYYYWDNLSQSTEVHGGEGGEIHGHHHGKYDYPNVYTASQTPLGSLNLFTWYGTFYYNLPAGTPTDGAFWFATDSPDLTADSDWQNITGFKAALYHYAPSDPATGPLQAQLLIHVRKPDDSEVYLYSDWNNLLKNQWQVFTLSPSSIPSSYVILNVRIAFLGWQADFPISSQLFIDDVTPILDGVVPPNPPTNLVATAISSSQITLSWQDNSTNEDGFKVERKTGAGGSWSLIQTVSANTTSYTDDGLTPNTTYYYRVFSYNSSGNSGYSNESSATTLDTNLPAAPSNLQAHLLPDQIHITWEDNSDSETGFVLEYKQFPGIMPVVWQVQDTLGENTTSYQMAKPMNNLTFYFRMYAFNEQGNSSYSNVDTLNIGYSLIWLVIDSPNGGEVWEPGSTEQITWRTGTMFPPSQVTIRLSIDGGSHWISPPIASNIENIGSYSWTIPETTSTNCIVKIEDASDGSPYDLSNDPFTLAREVSPILSLSPDTLDFCTLYDEMTFQITNTGSGTLTWNVAESPDEPWIDSITPSSGTDEDTVTVAVDRNQLTEDSDTGTLSVTSNGGNSSVIVLITRVGANLPSHWEFASNTGNDATVILPTSANPNIDGTPLAEGDYVGVFTPAELCCGWSQWKGENIAITVRGDNSQTPEIDGFQIGELIGYRVYRESEQKEWTSVEVGYSQGTGTYSVGPYQVLDKFDVSEVATITLNFGQGWNMFSVNVEPIYTEVDSVMSSIVDELVIMKNNDGQTYIPEFGINDIGHLDFQEGYQIYLTQAMQLVVTGQAVDPTTPIFLSAGWNMFAYLPNVSMDAATALASISGQLVIVKNNAGQSYVPQFSINDIGQMQPGQGYRGYLDAAGTLIYPSGGIPKVFDISTLAGVEEKELQKPLTEHFQFTSNTGEYATVVVAIDANPRYSDGNPLEKGDEIGVFTTAGLCCGAVVWDSVNAAISVWGDNVMTDSLDGFQEGDTLRFRVWKKSTDIEYPASVTYQTGHPCVYTANGLSVLDELIADLSTDVHETGKAFIPSDFKLYQNYPNPFNPETSIDFELPREAEVVITIYDLQGKDINQLIHKTYQAGYHSVKWKGGDYSENLVSSGIYFYRVVIKPKDSENRRIVKVRKMIFIK